MSVMEHSVSNSHSYGEFVHVTVRAIHLYFVALTKHRNDRAHHGSGSEAMRQREGWAGNGVQAQGQQQEGFAKDPPVASASWPLEGVRRLGGGSTTVLASKHHLYWRGYGHCSLVLLVEPSKFRAVQYESDSTVHLLQ